MQNLRKLCLSRRLGDLVGTALGQFPTDAGFCAAVERVQGGIVNAGNAGLCLCFAVRLVVAGSLRDSLRMNFTLLLCLYSEDVS